MLMKTKSFAFSVEEGLLFQWWNNEIHRSDQRQNPIYYVLCASYALVSVAALVQLVRIQIRITEYGWTTQKVVHFMTFLINARRAILFGLHRSVFSIRPKARSLPADKLKPCFYSINGIIYSIQICIWVYMSISKTAAGAESAILFLAVISFCAALGFLIYGGRLFILLLRFPIESRGRVNKLYEVGSVTCICCTCFLIRCIMLVEIMPSALVLFILRKVPPRQITDRYSLPLSTHRHMTSQCLPGTRFSPLFFLSRTLPPSFSNV